MKGTETFVTFLDEQSINKNKTPKGCCAIVLLSLTIRFDAAEKQTGNKIQEQCFVLFCLPTKTSDMKTDKSVMRLSKNVSVKKKSQVFFITEIAELPVIFGEKTGLMGYYVRGKNNRFGKQE